MTLRSDLERLRQEARDGQAEEMENFRKNGGLGPVQNTQLFRAIELTLDKVLDLVEEHIG